MSNKKISWGAYIKALLVIFGCFVIANTFATPAYTFGFSNRYYNTSCSLQISQQPQSVPASAFFLIESEENEENDELIQTTKFSSQAVHICSLFISININNTLACLNSLAGNISFAALSRHIVLQVFRI